MNEYKVSIDLWSENAFSIGPDDRTSINVEARSEETAITLAVATIDAKIGPYYEIKGSISGNESRAQEPFDPQCKRCLERDCSEHNPAT